MTVTQHLIGCGCLRWFHIFDPRGDDHAREVACSFCPRSPMKDKDSVARNQIRDIGAADRLYSAIAIRLLQLLSARKSAIVRASWNRDTVLLTASSGK